MRTIAAAIFALILNSSAFAAEPYAMRDIVLLQPESVIAVRVPAGAPAIAEYIKAINSAVGAKLASERDLDSLGVAIFVAARPGGLSNAWIGSESVTPKHLAEEIVAAVRSVEPPAVQGGTLLFAIDASVNGGTAPNGESLPLPKEWFAAMAANHAEITTVVDAIWKDDH